MSPLARGINYLATSADIVDVVWLFAMYVYILWRLTS